MYAVLASDAPGDRSSWVRRSAGGRHVAASREEIASNTELSDDQVKRGLKKLREEGLIVTSRGDGNTNIVVMPPEET